MSNLKFLVMFRKSKFTVIKRLVIDGLCVDTKSVSFNSNKTATAFYRESCSSLIRCYLDESSFTIQSYSSFYFSCAFQSLGDYIEHIYLIKKVNYE